MKDGFLSFSQYLYESSSQTIKDLAMSFGQKEVFCKSMLYTLTEFDAKRIFNILNNDIFQNKLDKIEIFRMSSTKILDKINVFCENQKSIPPFYAMYFAPFDFIYDDQIIKNLSLMDNSFDFKKVKIKFYDQMIFLNSDHLTQSNFIFATNCLCHEMIHYFDKEFGEEQDMMIRSSRFNRTYNSHKSPTFQKLKDIASNQRLKIEDEGIGMTYEELNKLAYDFMIEENEKHDAPPLKLIHGDDGVVYVDVTGIMHDTNTVKITGPHSGVLMHFD